MVEKNKAIAVLFLIAIALFTFMKILEPLLGIGFSWITYAILFGVALALLMPRIVRQGDEIEMG